MKSAFGVEHISKTQIPAHIGTRGGKFIRAQMLTTKEKAALANNLKSKQRFRRLDLERPGFMSGRKLP